MGLDGSVGWVMAVPVAVEGAGAVGGAPNRLDGVGFDD